jgi:hypothetical protein
MTFRHRLAHFLGWNVGSLEARFTEDKFELRFRCKGCNATATMLQGSMKSEASKNLLVEFMKKHKAWT